MALVYGLYYGLRHGRYDTLWVFGVLFVFFYLAFLLWQTYYAILTSRNSSWGTRTAAAEVATMTSIGNASVQRRGRVPAAAAVAGAAVLRDTRRCAARWRRRSTEDRTTQFPRRPSTRREAQLNAWRTAAGDPRARCRCSPTTA